MLIDKPGEGLSDKLQDLQIMRGSTEISFTFHYANQAVVATPRPDDIAKVICATWKAEDASPPVTAQVAFSGAPRGVSWLPGNPPKSVKNKYCIVINFEKREGERVT